MPDEKLMPDEKARSIKQLHGYMWHDIVDVLAKLPESEKKKVGDLIKTHKECQKKDVLDEWIKLLKEAKERYDKSVKGRIKSFFKKSVKRSKTK